MSLHFFSRYSLRFQPAHTIPDIDGRAWYRSAERSVPLAIQQRWLHRYFRLAIFWFVRFKRSAAHRLSAHPRRKAHKPHHHPQHCPIIFLYHVSCFSSINCMVFGKTNQMPFRQARILLIENRCQDFPTSHATERLQAKIPSESDPAVDVSPADFTVIGAKIQDAHAQSKNLSRWGKNLHCLCIPKGRSFRCSVHSCRQQDKTRSGIGAHQFIPGRG